MAGNLSIYFLFIYTSTTYCFSIFVGVRDRFTGRSARSTAKCWAWRSARPWPPYPSSCWRWCACARGAAAGTRNRKSVRPCSGTCRPAVARWKRQWSAGHRTRCQSRTAWGGHRSPTPWHTPTTMPWVHCYIHKLRLRAVVNVH